MAGDRLNSIASSTGKTLRSIVSDALALRQEPPTHFELIWGISSRGLALPIAVAAFVCLALDWHYAVLVDNEFSNTFLSIALITSLVLNSFLITNMILRLNNSPRATVFRRYLAYVDVCIIILLVSGSLTRDEGDNQDADIEAVLHDPILPNARILVFIFTFILAFLHFIGGAVMAISATKNWVQIQRLSPEEYQEYCQGIRPLYPPPAYGT